MANTVSSMSSEVDEACNGVTALFRLDSKAAADSSVTQSIQLAVRRLLILAPSPDKSQGAVAHENAKRQLEMLTRVLRHFGPAPLRSLRLLIAELIFRCLGAPSADSRKLAASLHRWLLVLFGSEVVQQRCEFLAVGLVRLLCQETGCEFQLAETPESSNEGHHEVLIKFNKSAIADSDSRLAEQLSVVAPIDLFVSYCRALINTLAPVASVTAPSVDLYICSILVLFDKFSEAILKLRSSGNTTSVTENARILGLSVPLFQLITSITTSKFRQQLIPVARRICKPVLLASTIFSSNTTEHNAKLFVAWANALRSNIEIFGFRTAPDEKLNLVSLELLLKWLRQGFEVTRKSQYSCSIVSAAVNTFASVLKRSVPAQRGTTVDSILISALRVVVNSFSDASGTKCHICPMCSQSICCFLSSGIMSPPLSSNGTPSSQPSVSHILLALTSNSRNANAIVALTFANTLSQCLTATARPLAPPMFTNMQSVVALPSTTEVDRVQLASASPQRDGSLLVNPSSSQSAAVLAAESAMSSSTTRRRLRSSSPAANICAPSHLASSSEGTLSSEKISSQLPKRSRRTRTSSQASSDVDDDDVIMISDSVNHNNVADETTQRDSDNISRNKNGYTDITQTTVDLTLSRDDAVIDGLFSSFVALPPDDPVVL